MVFDDREGECVGDDVDVFVGDVGFAIAGEVAEEVHRLVEVGDGIGLVADKVIKAVGAVGIDEAVANPLACSYILIDICDDFKGGFDTVLVCLTGLQSFYVGFAREAEDVEGFFAGEGDKLAGFGPVDLDYVSSTLGAMIIQANLRS